MHKLDIEFFPEEIQKILPPDIIESIVTQIRQHIPDNQLKILAEKSESRKYKDIASLAALEYICEKQAANKYQLSRSWFRNHRWNGTGPPYQKFGRLVRYKLSDLDEYFSSLKDR